MVERTVYQEHPDQDGENGEDTARENQKHEVFLESGQWDRAEEGKGKDDEKSIGKKIDYEFD